MWADPRDSVYDYYISPAPEARFSPIRITPSDILVPSPTSAFTRTKPMSGGRRPDVEMMDFSKFRETGELSDLTVVVDGKEHKLHKFPLFIKSDFFRALARSKLTEKDRVELADFPGGDATFQMVANYCYNIKIDITRSNVCKLRCAAEFLQMNSTANLADLTDRFLQDALTSAKLARNMGVIIELLRQCCSLGAIAEQAKIVERCISAIVDCWLIATKFNKRSLTPDRYDLGNLQKLTCLPLPWFKQLFVAARDKCVRSSVLAAMLEQYINAAIGESEPKPEKGENVDEGEAGKEEKEEKEEKEKEDDDKSADPEDEQDDPLEAADLDGENDDEEPDKKDVSEQIDDDSEIPPVDVKEALDVLIGELPETQAMTESLSPSWTIKVFCKAHELHCNCRDKLFQLVARVFPRLLPEDLASLPPELLCEIVQEASAGDAPTFRPELVSATIDQYLLELADKKKLSVDVFSKLVKAVPAENRENHDALFQVLEKLLNSEDMPLDDPERQKLLEEVDFSRLSESILQRAYEAELVPVSYVTQAALSLCSRLRRELDESKSVIRSQEDELEKYGLGGRGQMWLTRSEAGGVGGKADAALYDDNYDPVSHSHRRPIPIAGISPVERRSYEPLERAAGSPYSGYTRNEFTSPLHYGSYLDSDRPLYSGSGTDRYSDVYRRHLHNRWS